MPCSHSCYPAIGPPRQHYNTEPQSNGRGRAKMPCFGTEVLSSPLSLPTRRWLGTHFPPSTLGWWHFLSPLLEMPATAQLQAATDTGSIPVPLTLSMLDTPAPQSGIKWQHHSSDPGQEEEEAPSDTLEEPSHKKAETNGQGFQGGLARGLSLRTQIWWG